MTTITKVQSGGITVDLVQGDITKQKVDAIVNAANSGLVGGGGVDGAIHRAAGADLQRELNNIGRCPTGEARITKGYNLPAKHIIHAVGPVYRGVDNPAELLRSAHLYSLKLAQENDLKTIAFAAISTGIYGYPVDEASDVALNAVFDYIQTHQPDFELVRFVLFSSSILAVFSRTLGQLAQTRDDV